MNIAIIGKYSLFSAKISKSIVLALFFIFCFEFLLFPVPLIAQETGAVANDWGLNADLINTVPNEPEFINSFPESIDLDIRWSNHYLMTAYNSLSGQTDNSPCITANGFDLCRHDQEDSVAANFLPFGTKIRIPELFGDRIFVVRDRMNSRYTQRVDIWMKSYDNARDFGVKYGKIEVLKFTP